MSRPGNDEIQLDLFGDHASNVALYPRVPWPYIGLIKGRPNIAPVLTSRVVLIRVWMGRLLPRPRGCAKKE
jgi:hypothetical protein